MTDGFPAGEQQESVTTADGVRLRTVHLVPGPDAAPGLGIVLVPGFSCSWRKPFVRRVARWLSAYAGVLVVETRGQGRSGGRCTLGDDEALDVDAAVALARRSRDRVATVGFSMGGTAVLRQAGLAGDWQPVDAVVTVSAASHWWQVQTPRMRRLQLLATSPVGRAIAASVLRTRIDPGVRGRCPAAPIDVVGAVAPVPLLVVHGGRDAYLLPDNAEALYAAAGEPRELWLWPEYGHAELALTQPQAAAIGSYLVGAVGGNMSAS